MCLALSIDHKNACDSKNKKVLIFFNSPLRYIFKVNLISVWYQYQRQYQCYRYLDRSAHLYQWSIIWCPCRWWITSGKIKELNKNGFLLNKVYRCDHADLFSRKVQLDSLKKKILINVKKKKTLKLWRMAREIVPASEVELARKSSRTAAFGERKKNLSIKKKSFHNNFTVSVPWLFWIFE